jgi:hypothetical protein
LVVAVVEDTMQAVVAVQVHFIQHQMFLAP